MKVYCFVDWRLATDGEGFEADLPENVCYSALAEPRGSEYALVECDLPTDVPLPAGVERVSEELTDLLDAAQQYAPALALSRDRMRRVADVSRSEFSSRLTAVLRDYVSAQRQSRFFMAQACKTEHGYKYAGSYYWIVGYRSDRVGHEVSWVSRDFYVYRDNITDFDVDATYLKQRFD